MKNIKNYEQYLKECNQEIEIDELYDLSDCEERFELDCEDYDDDMDLDEGRKQIKRVYGQYPKIRVNEEAKLRNEIIKSVGKKLITNEQLKSIFSKIGESRSTFCGDRWLKENSKYFERMKGDNYRLSKLGNRVFDRLSEMEVDGKMVKMTGKKLINED